MKISNFTRKNLCLLYGQVFVMRTYRAHADVIMILLMHFTPLPLFQLVKSLVAKRKDFPHHKNDNLLCLFCLPRNDCQRKLLIVFYINVNDINRGSASQESRKLVLGASDQVRQN